MPQAKPGQFRGCQDSGKNKLDIHVNTNNNACLLSASFNRDKWQVLAFLLQTRLNFSYMYFTFSEFLLETFKQCGWG